MSCNGCRVLRKGCSNDCVIRPCLEWIKSPESQANATIFLAKFYGRVGLVNLINTAPVHLRPAIFRSLLYEACGRIVNPIHGSVGLLWTGNWRECQSAVDSVLKAGFIVKNTALDSTKPPFPADIEPYGHVIGHQPDMMIAGENNVKPYGSCFKRRRTGRGLKYEDNSIVYSSSTSDLHRSSGGVNGAVKLELTLGDHGHESSPAVADDDQADQK